MNYTSALTFLAYFMGSVSALTWVVIGIMADVNRNFKVWWVWIPTITTLITLIAGFFAAGLR